MRFTALLIPFIFLAAAFSQSTGNPVRQPASKSATVPFLLDQDRIILKVEVPLADGSTQTVRAWVETGKPELRMSRRVAKLMGLTVYCAAQSCIAKGSLHDILVGGMIVSLSSIGEAEIPADATSREDTMMPGMNAEINLPAKILRNYAVVIDFPARRFTIGVPGSIKFDGLSSKVVVNPENGLIQVPSKIENKNYNLGLDTGASMSFLSNALFDALAAAHSDWPRMIGAVGPANMWGASDELNWKLLRVERLQYGLQFLSGTVVASLPAGADAGVAKREGTSTAGVLGSSALVNLRVGIDYARKLVYFEIGSTVKPPDFDVVGLTLRPEIDSRFTVVGIAEFEGKPALPVEEAGVQIGDHLVAVGDIPAAGATLGQVWSMLRGTPGQERRLTLERNGNQFTVVATVRHFLDEAEETPANKKSSKRP